LVEKFKVSTTIGRKSCVSFALRSAQEGKSLGAEDHRMEWIGRVEIQPVGAGIEGVLAGKGHFPEEP